jgi:hypothetical protein
MRLIKTIVATAVIVFALTTVAMAGVQRLGHETQAATGTAQTQAAATGAVAQHSGPVTLSARQFAALLRAVAHDGDRDRAEKKAHRRSSTRTHTQAKARTHSTTHTAQHAQKRTSPGAGSTHRSATQAHTHTATHAQTYSGTHDGGTHDGGANHDGGHD